MSFMLNVVYAECQLCCVSFMLSVAFVYCYAEYSYAECHYTENRDILLTMAFLPTGNTVLVYNFNYFFCTKAELGTHLSDGWVDSTSFLNNGCFWH